MSGGVTPPPAGNTLRESSPPSLQSLYSGAEGPARQPRNSRRQGPVTSAGPCRTAPAARPLWSAALQNRVNRASPDEARPGRYVADNGIASRLTTAAAALRWREELASQWRARGR